MKKAIIFFMLILFGCLSMIQSEPIKDIYVRTLFVEKIFIYSLGYVVVYDKPSSMNYGTVYLPFTWFSKIGGAGEMVWGRHVSYPYLSIFWVNGKFSHVKLYVQENMSHPSWDKLRGSSNEVNDRFKVTPETFEIEF